MSKHPMDEHKEYWLWAHRRVGTYPESVHSGKWMLFIPDAEINEAWDSIRTAVEEGKLGNTAKVATARPNPNAQDRHSKLICVYTYDAEDKEDVVRILQALRDLGFSQGLSYKTDEATLAGEYSFNTAGPVSLYYAYKGTVELSTPKGKSPKKRIFPTQQSPGYGIYVFKGNAYEGQFEEVLQEILQSGNYSRDDVARQLLRSQIPPRRKPRETSYDSERTEEWLQENDFYESSYFHDIMNRDD